MDTSIYQGFVFWSVLALAIVIWFHSILITRRKRGSVLPPGPKAWPVIGNLHLMAGKLPHRDLAKLSLQYGPLLSLKIGSRPALIVSSAIWAKEILQTHDKEFGNRPQLAFTKDLGLGNMAFAETGDYWRQMRKISMLNLLSPKKIEAWQALRMDEVRKIMKQISSKTNESGLGNEGRFVDIFDLAMSLVASFMGQLLFTSSLSEQTHRLKLLMDRINVELAAPLIADFIPSLSFLDILANRKKEAFVVSLHGIMQEIVNLRRSQVFESDEPQCLLDFMLTLQQQEGHLIDSRDQAIQGFVGGLFGASIDTTTTLMEWVMADLMKHPEMLEKVREEIRREVGRPWDGVHLLDDKEVGTLKYLEAVVKETLRFHPPVPLLLPRESMENCMVGEYEVRKGTLVFVNAWAIGRDPELWKNPNEFIPERFSGKEDGLIWQQGLLAFGGGRRSCPGKAVALTTVHLLVANLLYAFDWKTGYEYHDALNMGEKMGAIGMRKEKPLMLIPTPRHTNF